MKKRPVDAPAASDAVRKAQAWKGPSGRAERPSADGPGHTTSSNVRSFVRGRKSGHKRTANAPTAEDKLDDGPEPDPRRAALVRLIFILLLVVGGVLLVRVLTGMSQLQDCVMSGRTNCAPITAPGH